MCGNNSQHLDPRLEAALLRDTCGTVFSRNRFPTSSSDSASDLRYYVSCLQLHVFLLIHLVELPVVVGMLSHSMPSMTVFGQISSVRSQTKWRSAVLGPTSDPCGAAMQFQRPYRVVGVQFPLDAYNFAQYHAHHRVVMKPSMIHN
jgi:hypothetical protein